MPIKYVDSKLMTKFGEFNIRVYSAPRGNETVVLTKGEFNSKFPVLVRIHSECLTGDTFCGLNCDCGKQLAKALTLINREGGALIYLRQEGRGIGLFEKIRSYQYQDQGYDTSEANVMLGHLPDERSYEMAKTVLEDLKIHCIKLLTNNPAKVSELAKLGIVISERVPLITKSNKYNRSYLAAKKAKFNHSFTDKANHYFYQFHADSSEQVEAIGEFLQNKINDPLMMICVGVTANRSLFKDKAQITRILSIYNTCNLYSRFVHVLHFSFRDSVDLFKDLS